MFVQPYSNTTIALLSGSTIIIRFLSGEIYQLEIGIIVFINFFLLFYRTLGLGRKWIFPIIYLSLVISLGSVTITSKYNDLLSTIKNEQSFVAEETTRQVYLLRDRLLLQIRSNHLYDHEQTIVRLIGFISSSGGQYIGMAEQILSIFPKAEQRTIQLFIKNVENTFQQSLEEIQLKKEQLLSLSNLYDHFLVNIIILNKYSRMMDLLTTLSILNVFFRFFFRDQLDYNKDISYITLL